MPITPIVQAAGAGTIRTASHRTVFKSKYGEMYLPIGKTMDGSKCADATNTGDTRKLQAGLLMGKVTATGKWANSIIGVTTVAYTSGATSITVDPKTAVEIVRRIGSSGNLTYVGPPTAAGTVANTASVAFSAVNTTTGVITVTSLGVDKIAGTFVCDTDGTYPPIAFLPDGWPIAVIDDSGNNVDVDFPMIPVGGIVQSDKLINWPTDTSQRAEIVKQLSVNGQGQFTFSHLYDN